MELVRRGDDIVIRLEEYDASREIHMDPTATAARYRVYGILTTLGATIGLALGCANAGIGLGSTLLPILVIGPLIAAYSWRHAVLVASAFLMALLPKYRFSAGAVAPQPEAPDTAATAPQRV